MSVAAAPPPRKLTFKDPEVVRCPYAAYEYLRDEAPVYFDEEGDFYVLTRYDDIRDALRDPTAFDSDHVSAKMRAKVHGPRDDMIVRLFAEEGFPRDRPVGNYEGAAHKERRALFEAFLRAGKVRDYDPIVEKIANELVESFADDGHAELVSQFSEQLSMRIICHLVGAPDDALPIVKRSMDAMIANIGLIMSDEEAIENARREIEAQHYFKAMIDRLRLNPDDTILSALVNAKLPSGDEMTDPQILRHVMLDLFMAGAETSAKAITSGIAMLTRNPEVYAALEADQETHLKVFIEEILRLEGPASQMARQALRDVTIHGVTIPKGSIVIFRAAAANLDPRKFECPSKLDLDRSNAAQHLSFGSGTHACVGAPLARRELYYGFKALLDRLEDIRLAPGETAEYVPNIHFRGIERLNITFRRKTPKAA